MNDRATVYQIVSDQILQALDKGEIPWRKPWAGMAMPCNFVSKKPYRGINVWLLASRGYASPWWLSFKQVGQKGGRVKAGEHGTIVVYWKVGKVKERDTVTGEEYERDTFLLRYYRVWNSEQCEGIEIPKQEVREHKPIEEGEAVWNGYAGKPDLKHGGARACYVKALDRIEMPKPESFYSGEEYYSTLFHEAVHSTGHDSRLKRLDKREDGMGWHEDYSREELVAEMGAAYLANLCGIANAKTMENAAAYIQHWRNAIAKDNRLVVMAASKAQKAVDWITGKRGKVESAE